jgi:hypothetical protein
VGLGGSKSSVLSKSFFITTLSFEFLVSGKPNFPSKIFPIL